MTTNAMPQQPAEKSAVPGGLTDHDRHVGAIAAWLWETTGSDLAVDVVTGTNRVAVARGRYVDMEAHPSAKGVYRVVFDSSQAGPDGPTGEPWITVGHEVVDVAAGDRSLIIDKGSQRIEIHVVGAEAPVGEPAAGTTPAAAVAPDLAPAVPGTSADVTRVTPAAPPVVEDDVSILEDYAPGLEAVANAPTHQNVAVPSSKLFGETRLEVVGNDLKVTARRMRHGTPFLVLTGMIVGAFVLPGAMLVGVQMVNARTGVADTELLQTTVTGTLVVAAVGIALYLAGRLLSAGRQPETFTVPLSAVKVRKAGRYFVFKLPISRKGRTRKLVVKPAGKADKARLKKIVEAIRE